MRSFRRVAVARGLVGVVFALQASGVSGAEAKSGPVTVEAELTIDAMRVVSGGSSCGEAYPSLVRVGATVDAERGFGWKGATWYGSVMRLGGRSPSDRAGDAQGLSNIDGPNAWWVHEAWIEQRLGSGDVTIRAGLYDLSAEFDVVDSGSLFLNGSHGTGPEFSQSGINGPSVFPYTALGLRGRFRAGRGYVQVAALDGVPGHPDGSPGTTIRIENREGLLLVAEGGAAGWGGAGRAKAALGAWHYTHAHAIVDDAAGTRENETVSSTGLYAILEGSLVAPDAGLGGGLGGWVRVGIADPDSNRFGRYVGGGLVWHGPFPRRGGDALGLAVAHATNGGTFLAAQRDEGTARERSESVVEATYRFRWTDWLSLQPDVQWVRNPDTDPRRRDALAIGLRFRITVGEE